MTRNALGGPYYHQLPYKKFKKGEFDVANEERGGPKKKLTHNSSGIAQTLKILSKIDSATPKTIESNSFML